MYYKLYIDSVFLLQMTSNLYLLSLAGRILECTATHKRIFAGAAAGALMSCLALATPLGTVGVRSFVSAVPVSMCMLWTVFRIGHGKKLLYASMVFAGCGFFLGSVMIWILNRLRTILKGKLGLMVTLAAGYVSYRVLSEILLHVRRRKENCIRTVEIPVAESGQGLRVQAFLDTGNHLADPISGEPVSLVSRELAAQLASVFRPEKYHIIPFRSVGRDRGVLNAYELPELFIETGGGTLRREHVIVAVCNTGISEESVYQMILHPGLLED